MSFMAYDSVRIIDIKGIPEIETQIIYEATAIAQSQQSLPDTIIICWPNKPLVCIGYHQIAQKEIEIEYCEENEIPIVRRVLGGGAVYLNKDQIFYQYIFNGDSPLLPKTNRKFFEEFLKPVVKTYNDFKVKAKYKPVNDVEANNKKISGTGAGTSENSKILTGNFILDFDYSTMVKVLKVPDEKFRDKIYKSLQDRLTTFKKELGYIPKRDLIISQYIQNIKDHFNVECEKQEITKLEKEIIQDLYKKYTDEKWINLIKESKSELLNREIKISKNSGVAQIMHKASGGLIKIIIELKNEIIKDIVISGDFFIYPEDSLRDLENILKGNNFKNIEKIHSLIKKFYKENDIESPGVKPVDYLKALKRVKTDVILD
ncbi:MAG: hypothetical protein GF329_05665 [Candidatus Lokiarchaeota archaeon]|nr:hypothetical protein [Candidatus Lokiarchaeota archaeon]